MTNIKNQQALRRYLQSSFSCLYLALGGLLLRQNRALMYPICRHFGFEQDPPAKSDDNPESEMIPTVPVSEAIGATQIALTEIDSTDGNVSLLELAVIAGLVKKHQAKRCMEIGTFDGRTALNMALNQPEGSEVITLDLPANGIEKAGRSLEAGDHKYIEKPESGIRFKHHELRNRITQLYGDSATYDFSPYANTIDLMFVDGSHSYDYVKKDTETALSLVKEGGIILWHDYNTQWWPGVTAALNEIFNTPPWKQGIRAIQGTSLCFGICKS